MMITKNTTIKNVLTANISNALILESFGLNCTNCSHALEETIEMGSKIHNVDIDELLEALNNS